MRFNLFGFFLVSVALTGCVASQQDPADPEPLSPAFVIDVPSHIALHRAFLARGDTYLEFLDAYRMNPVITGPDGVPLPFRWNQQYVILDGIHPNLTVTTAHGVAHVYVRQPARPARVAAPTPARAPGYGVREPLMQPIVPE